MDKEKKYKIYIVGKCKKCYNTIILKPFVTDIDKLDSIIKSINEEGMPLHKCQEYCVGVVDIKGIDYKEANEEDLKNLDDIAFVKIGSIVNEFFKYYDYI